MQLPVSHKKARTFLTKNPRNASKEICLHENILSIKKFTWFSIPNFVCSIATLDTHRYIRLEGWSRCVSDVYTLGWQDCLH